MAVQWSWWSVTLHPLTYTVGVNCYTIPIAATRPWRSVQYQMAYSFASDLADRHCGPLFSIFFSTKGDILWTADSHSGQIEMFFRKKNDSRTRGHSLASVKCHSRLDIRKYTFSEGVVHDWNKLPEECINATSVNMFKNIIDQDFLKKRRE